MTWFEAFRNEHGFTSYSDNRTPVTFHFPLLILTYLCILVSIATLIATLGIRGRERWSSTIRAMYAVGIGSIILACLIGYGWQEGSVKIKSAYVYRNNLPFEGYVGIKVALDAVNVTLDGYYHSSSGPGYVYYDEMMPWSDFGHEKDLYSYFLTRGLPDPILRVMEFLTVDEGGLRWGRSFQSAGHYANALLWTSFAFWVVSTVLLCSVIIYGAYMFTMTGLTMILSCVAYHVCQCPLPLTIGFGDQTLRIYYSWCYWLTLAAGCLTFVLGIILIITDHLAHDGVSEFFHLEKLIDDDSLEQDNHREIYPTNPIDRRGSVVPPSTERRGSIFMDQCRPPGMLNDKFMRSSFQPTGTFLHGSVSSKGSPIMKTNPLYRGDDKMKNSTADDHEDDMRIAMERVCGDIEVCMSTKKPSLATMKEHRENHKNERLSSSTGKLHRQIPELGQQGRRVAYQEGIFTIGSPANDPCNLYSGPRRESCPTSVYIPHVIDRSISEASVEMDTVDSRPQSTESCEVLVCVESRRNSHEDSATTCSASTESDQGYSGEKIDVSESECEMIARKHSENSDVFVNIS